ncbi:hypothetical protein [Maribacter sp. ACAM166]|uniref:hypothetical protein n=1 Tax=Maribacter sp. ACAM166 TaxID=2508996 RepID=UPI0010FEA07D|nr:hypothetical protein [Maribacter sp. ACAM166]TLP74288.1 hypothetical protein ES765_16480 [Maribacter sp. ACAM166]
MKKGIAIIMLLLLVLACKEENNPLNKIKEVTGKVKEVKQGLDNFDNIIDGAEDMQKNIKKLSELTPVSKEQIKDWMPEEVGDLKLTEYDISSQMGLSVFKLSYKGDDEKKKKINIIISDGAGKGSALVAMFSMFQNIEIDTENESGYERTQTFEGQRTLTKYQTSEKYEKATLQCLINQRFGIEANAWNMNPDELWNFIKKLEIEKLVK